MVVIEAKMNPNYNDRNIFYKNVEILVFEEDDHEICFDFTFSNKSREDDTLGIIFDIEELLTAIGKALVDKE